MNTTYEQKLEIEISRLRSALNVAEAALADIGDADRELTDDLEWCELRAAQALPAVRAALFPIDTKLKGHNA